MKSVSRMHVDLAACGLSAACLAHCLALPMLASLLPLLGPAAETEWLHWLFVAIACPLALIAFGRRGVTVLMRIVAGAGVLLLVAGAAEFPSHEWETAMTVLGAVFLAGAHMLNALRFARRTHTHPAVDRL